MYNMMINGQYAEYLSQVFRRALQEGDRYVCFASGTEARTFPGHTMRFFTDKEMALNYGVLTRIADNEHLATAPILPVLQQLNRKIELQHMGRPGNLQLVDIPIDINVIRFDEKARVQTFTEQISRQLADIGFKPDLKELHEHINKDDQRFTVSAVRLEQGAEKSYTISIRQDEHRVFEVFKIQQTITNHKNQVQMKSEVLEGSVRAKDATEIKETLQKEKEHGYRFVSFPANKAGLTIEDFAAFKTAAVAYEHATNSSNQKEKYLVRSIAVIEKEMERVIENKKQHGQESLESKEGQRKRSRDQEMDR